MRTYTTSAGTTVRLKDDTVNMEAADSEAVDPILDAAAPYYAGCEDHFVVTSAADGVHSLGSLHDDGLALDLRTWPWSHEEARRIAAQIQADLGPDYDFIYEASPPHFHGELDPD